MSTSYHDLTGFQRDLLGAIARIESRDETPYGLGIVDELGPHYDEVHHGRIYPNLDELAEAGLIEKQSLDQRTNSYELTERGRGMLVDHVQALVAALDVEFKKYQPAIPDGSGFQEGSRW